jgi:hypothetical protein
MANNDSRSLLAAPATIPPQHLHNIGGSSVQDQYSTSLLPQNQEWTRNLIHLAKAAELKKHALNLQLHTAHILSAHMLLDEKNKTLQDVREQRNRCAQIINSISSTPHNSFRTT